MRGDSNVSNDLGQLIEDKLTALGTALPLPVGAATQATLASIAVDIAAIRAILES